MTDSAVLAHISKLPHARATFKQLVKELGARSVSRGDIEASLDRLSGRGQLIEFKSGHFAVASRSREFVVGKVNAHRDGFAFVVADHPLDHLRGDLFLPPHEAEGAMHGDRVLARIVRIDPDGKAEGEILKILHRAQPSVVGEFRIGRRHNHVIPLDDRLRTWIRVPEGMEFPPLSPARDRIGVEARPVTEVSDLDGLIVTVELLEYPQGQDAAVGRVIEVLGARDDFGVDVEIVIRKHHLPHRFPEAVIAQAERAPEAISPDDLRGRRDFRSYEVVTIDGETARDFDDAVWAEPLANGNFALHVHIADVSHYVKPGSPIDREALLRGTSVYFPDRAVPMLPHELSTHICSLVPNQDRLVMSAVMEFTPRGERVSAEFCRGVIRSRERMTYTAVHALLEGDAAVRERYAGLVQRFEWMRDLAAILNRHRERRGSIDFDLPEPLIEFDENGLMTGVVRSPRNFAHRLIEEFMLAANEAVAGCLEEELDASIYRIHEKPDPKRVADFEESAVQFGYSLGAGAIPVRKHTWTARHRDGSKTNRAIERPDEIPVTSRHYQKLVARIEGKPEERILSFLMLRSLKQARYSTDNSGHFALAAPTYTHFTSPIRRYPDLMIHRLLGAWLDRNPVTLGEDELSGIAEECSRTERRAAEAERELVEWKKAKFMEQRVGDVFEGLIISVARFGLFVELNDLFVEGLLPIDVLPGDRYTFRENVRKIVGQNTGREFSIGDRIEVCLDRVDPAEHKLQFSLYETRTRRNEKRAARHAARSPKSGRSH